MNERDRIELLMKCHDLSASQFADKTGVQRASISHILSGRNKPSLDVMLKIYEAFPGLDIKWLMTGVGEEPLVAADSVNGDGLFGAVENSSYDAASSVLNVFAQEPAVKKLRQQQDKPRQLDVVEKRKPSQQRQLQQQSVVRKIKEVRIFYTDGTYETLLPEK